ncbi:hypothetical protein AAVH_18040 [Aphelenchoides avenae]|nr:hypothetical protein AAVH_18040 [Aphelenchus avenae]
MSSERKIRELNRQRNSGADPSLFRQGEADVTQVARRSKRIAGENIIKRSTPPMRQGPRIASDLTTGLNTKSRERQRRVNPTVARELDAEPDRSRASARRAAAARRNERRGTAPRRAVAARNSIDAGTSVSARHGSATRDQRKTAGARLEAYSKGRQQEHSEFICDLSP